MKYRMANGPLDWSIRRWRRRGKKHGFLNTDFLFRNSLSLLSHLFTQIHQKVSQLKN